jgi:hypothetical protein
MYIPQIPNKYVNNNIHQFITAVPVAIQITRVLNFGS